eukprot:gnl/MRDRNA2_/MRDRNA2_110565_c0_seq1.p1 gnl/MRDRNA2_/MRDRNA2_110565_c0~~gnl/MRDRNA2_/MRDRNA2_110565_c0_seq1.p1  ORF type:complete len:1178 (+),score=128.58 gnl/MRDRNA2_/MRDRNA2_110565_c0_seq1:53-3586(+)
MLRLQASGWAALNFALLANLSSGSFFSWWGSSFRSQSRQLQTLYRNNRCTQYCFECWEYGPGKCDTCIEGYKILNASHLECTPICSADCFNCTAVGPGGCDECDEGFFKTSGRCKANPPEANAAYLEFEDVEPMPGWIRGDLLIAPPKVLPSGKYTDYIVFFGTNSTQVKGGSFATVPVQTSNGSQILTSVSVPMTRVQGFRPLTHVLVFASNQGTMGDVATSIEIKDFFCTENCISCLTAGQESCDQCEPGFFLKAKPQSARLSCIPYPPTIEALSVSFADEDKDSGQIAGLVHIKCPSVETNITHYAIHFSRSAGKLDDDGLGDTLIGRAPTTGEGNVSFKIPADTRLPMGATFLVVLTENGGSSMKTGPSLEITDAGFLSAARAMTLAGGLPLDSTRSVSTLGGGYEGSSLSQLNTPADVFVYGDLGIFVADMGNHRVLHFPPGSYCGIQASVLLENDRDAENLYPAAVQVVDMVAMQAPTTEWLQVLSGSQSRSLRIDFLSRPPAPMTVRPPVTLINQDSSATGLNAPEAAQLFEGSLYVVDTGNHRVRMFLLPSLVVHTVAGGWGAGDALYQLNSPRHLAVRSEVDTEGGLKKVWIYVADTINHRVVMSEQPVDFTSERKQFVAKVVAGGKGPGTSSSQLFEPSGIFVTADGKFLFVADSGNSRVQKWQIGGDAGLTVAGSITSGASATQLAYPRRVQVIEHKIHRPNGIKSKISTLIVVDSGNHRVQRLPPLMATASTCTLGRPCELALSINRPDVTLRLVKGDIVRIVPLTFDTWCGAGKKNSSQPSSSQCGNLTSWKGITNPNRLSKIRGTAVQKASHHFPAATEGPVGEFRICWGSNVPDVQLYDCESTPIDVGILVMQGPLPGQTAKCVLGVPCRVDLQGVGLQIGNRLALRYIGGSVNGNADCDHYKENMTQNTWNRVDHWEWPIQNLVPYASAFGQVTSAAHFSYSEGHRGPIGKQYMLCWTEGWPLGIPPDSKVLVYPDHGLEYRVRVGTFEITGPQQGINTTCWLNEACTVTLYGIDLMRSNGIRLVRQDDDPNAAPCNDFMPVPVPSAKVVGLTNPVGANQVAPNGESVTFLLGTPEDDDNLGNYTICWGNTFDENPTYVESYNIQVGIWALYERPYELRKRRNSTEPVATSGSMESQLMLAKWWFAIFLAYMSFMCIDAAI